MGNYFNELRWKFLEPTIFFNLYTKSPALKIYIHVKLSYK